VRWIELVFGEGRSADEATRKIADQLEAEETEETEEASESAEVAEPEESTDGEEE